MKFFKNIVKYFICWVYKFKYISKSVRFGTNIYFDRDTFFEGHNIIYNNTKLYNCSVGTGSYVGENGLLRSIKIGRFCSIGANLRIIAGRHPTKDFVSTHPCFFSRSNVGGFSFVKKQLFKEIIFVNDGKFIVEIGNDVWLGDNVSIMDGVKIGHGAVIGSNSLVTKNIDPYTINVGIPAKSIKLRFNQRQINFLLDFKWWDKDFNWIQNHSSFFSDINQFIVHFKENENLKN